MNNFQEKLDGFIEKCQLIIVEYHKQFPNLEVPKLKIDPKGKRYIRIIKGEGTPHCSVYCFIAASDGSTKTLGNFKEGDVLKAAGWKAPAKGARGNIFDDHNGTKRMSAYGTDYN